MSRCAPHFWAALLFLVPAVAGHADTAAAQASEVDAATQEAVALRRQARCLRRAATRLEQIARRLRQARGEAARERLRERLEQIRSSYGECEPPGASLLRGVGVGAGSPPVPPPAPEPWRETRVRLHLRDVESVPERADARRVVAMGLARFRGCLQRMVGREGPDSLGALHLRLSYTVNPDGVVEAFEVRGAPESAEACLERVGRFLRHGPAAAAGRVTVVLEGRLEVIERDHEATPSCPGCRALPSPGAPR